LNEPDPRDPGALRGNPIKTAASDHSAPVHSSAQTGNCGGESNVLWVSDFIYVAKTD